ncbi:MAG: hypothetical protein ABI607_10560 [Betaproteobacteria bacterium]
MSGAISPKLLFLGEIVERKPVLAALCLVALTLLCHMALIATPGFYGNDEWQKFDHLRLHGVWDYVQAYGAIRPGPEFGYPVRPLGFLQQGFAAQWMQSAPFASHLISVIIHALVALAFVWVLRRARVPGNTAGLASVLFVLSPLATMATGWTAASFDQLYILFLLLAAAAIVRVPEKGLSPWRAAWLVLATTAALLSKETAVVAPGVVLLLGYLAWCRNPGRLAWKTFGAAFGAVLLPVVVYLIFRAPAISASLAGQATAEYTVGLGNAPDNAWRFFTYPFRLKLVETSAAVFRSPWQPLAAGAAHLVLVGAVGRLFGWRYAVAYIAAYFLFLLPVLVLPNPGTQCLYGAALAMSLALAATITRLLATGPKFALALMVAGAVALWTHGMEIQRHLHVYGQCQTRFLTSLDNLMVQQSPSANAQLVIVPDAGAPARIAIRAVAYREAYMAHGQPTVTFVLPDQPNGSNGSPPTPGATLARMSATCTLRRD